MNLAISNFAKIAYAEIEFDGLAVVAGNNNAGFAPCSLLNVVALMKADVLFFGMGNLV